VSPVCVSADFCFGEVVEKCTTCLHANGICDIEQEKEHASPVLRTQTQRGSKKGQQTSSRIKRMRVRMTERETSIEQ